MLILWRPKCNIKWRLYLFLFSDPHSFLSPYLHDCLLLFLSISHSPHYIYVSGLSYRSNNSEGFINECARENLAYAHPQSHSTIIIFYLWDVQKLTFLINANFKLEKMPSFHLNFLIVGVGFFTIAKWEVKTFFRLGKSLFLTFYRSRFK